MSSNETLKARRDDCQKIASMIEEVGTLLDYEAWLIDVANSPAEGTVTLRLHRPGWEGFNDVEIPATAHARVLESAIEAVREKRESLEGHLCESYRIDLARES